MNIHEAGLCFLPSLLLVICSLETVRSTSECRGKDCRPDFACPGPYNCSCTKSSGDYNLLCPSTGHRHVLFANILPSMYIQIECTGETHFTDYNLLNGLAVGPVTTVNFKSCPLPNVPFAELTKTIGVTSTKTLLFQSYRNLSNTLERKHFTGLGNLTRLLLSSNGLTDLPEDLLQDLPNLTWLDLRGNNMRVHENFFNSVPKLQVLELGSNNLVRLEPGMFRELKKLQLLNLWNNRLKNLTRDVFSHLTNLEQLDVSSNLMTSLASDVFRDLHKLVKISLHANNYSRIPENLFSETPKLEVLRLYDNRQTMILPDYFLSNLTELKEIYLMRNNLQSVPENIFWGSPAITNLTFQGNSLREIPEELFSDQINLKTLDLSYNQLRYLPDGAFKHLGNLVFLRLGSNRLQNITRDAFQGLYNLELLDLEYNDLSYLDGEALAHMNQLKHARFSHNLLSLVEEEVHLPGGIPYRDQFENYSPFSKCVNLEYLYLSNNSIAEIFSDWKTLLVKLRVLDISHNRIQHLVVQDVQFLSNDISVDLQYNNISIVNLDTIENLAKEQSTDLSNPQYTRRNVRILLEGNPLLCDCRAYEMIRYFEKKLHPAVYAFVTLVPGNLTCALPESHTGIQATRVNSYDLMCSFEENCPEPCECLFRRADLGLIVNCKDKKMREVPKRLPQFRYVNHTELILDGNEIRTLPNTTRGGYDNVTHLYLSRNKIANIDSGLLSAGLRELTLDHNNITKLSGNLIQFLKNSSQVHLLRLNDNPWHCDCSARDLLGLIQLKFKQIPHLSNVTCSSDNRPLFHLSVSDLCPVSMAVIVSCVFVAAFGFLVAFLAVFYYQYQREIKVWLYSHQFCLWFVTEEELDKDKLYDAFVSYSHKDEDFVVNTLVPELESGETPLKLCLHYRDWIAGEWIPNQIARSVENSRRTLVVLSPNFLESVWGRLEFRAAHKQALSEARARVIVVLYGDVGPTDQLDPELRAYISMNTYVKWGDPWFWRKLKYALPHPPSLVKTPMHLLKGRGSRRENGYIDDKLELIHTLNSPSIPAGGTTPPAEAAVTAMETVNVINRSSVGNSHSKAVT